jgi:hypothetical protein
MRKNTFNFASLFDNNLGISSNERTRVEKEIEKVGGLTFKIHIEKDGWYAECKEVPGIIAANANSHPSSIEIESQIRDAIFAAFNVRIEKPSKTVKSPFVFEYSFS